MGVLQAVTLKMALSPNRVVPLDEEGCGKMAKAHTAPGVAGNASFSPTQTGDRALFIGVAPSIVLRYRANEGRTSVCEMDAVPTGVGIERKEVPSLHSEHVHVAHILLPLWAMC